jgi:serine protease AprX
MSGRIEEDMAMSGSAGTARGTAPTRVWAAAAALALLAVPVPAASQGSAQTVLLATTGGTTLTQLADSVSAVGGRVLETLSIADSLLVELPAGIMVPGGVAVPDVSMKVNSTSRSDAEATVSTYRRTIGAPDDDSLGAGVTVALIDTGVADVPDLAHVEHRAVRGVGSGDKYGHGTFLAGIIGGRGAQPGVAPGAGLLDVKVADGEGGTSLSKVLSGLQIAADADVDVVSLSLSTASPLPPGFDPLSRALERLWERGVVSVVAAGNDGADGEVQSPGNHPTLLTVGSVDEGTMTGGREDDSVASFSSRGSTSGLAKPDLVAPGTSIVSTMAPGSVAASRTAWNDGTFMRGSGTSMSTALAAGAAAAVLAANPELQPNGVKALLVGTTYSNDDLEPADGAGAGALDLGAALAAAGAADLDPEQSLPGAHSGDWGPSEADGRAWAAFAAAWKSGDLAAAKAAWAELSWQTKQWASRAWMTSVLASSLGLSEPSFEARSWAARSWAFDGWLARSWAARSWAARSWAFDQWLARSWAARSWAARSWAARSWAADGWLARSWAARSWADDEWAARSWAARSWATSGWSADSWGALD